MHSKHGALSRHLKEAIQINTERMPLYAKLTNGASVPLSKKLILSEKLALLFSWIIDLIAFPYQLKGIKIADLEYISMSKVPLFSHQFPFVPDPLSDFVPVDGKALSLRLKKSFKNGGFKSVSELANQELINLSTYKTYHSMVRHLLESLIRAANLASVHENKAIEIGFYSPRFISWLIVYGHFPTFESGANLDMEMAPIQSKGIPFLWQDIPHIPANELY